MKVIDDRVHSIGRLLLPEYLRGMTVLTIEAKDRGHERTGVSAPVTVEEH